MTWGLEYIDSVEVRLSTQIVAFTVTLIVTYIVFKHYKRNNEQFHKYLTVSFSMFLIQATLDENEIRQLIVNLVNNGVEAMEPGGVLVIETYMDGQDVILKIEDHGKGISPEVLNNLGTPFITTKEKGTGLGLAVCYSIALRHNAHIDVQTSPSGTAFSVRFALHKSQEIISLVN
ncbi:MAG: ATP-binding protein [Bacillota bacterium]